SIGTNDLVQYALAVDRGNARLAPRFNPFHPAVLNLLKRIARAARAPEHGIYVCGELASSPHGVFLLIGLGITVLSVSPASLPEVKKVIRSVPAADAREAVGEALQASTATEVTAILTEQIERWLDLSFFSGRWNPTHGGREPVAWPLRRTWRETAGEHPPLHIRVRHGRASGQDRGSNQRRDPGRGALP